MVKYSVRFLCVLMVVFAGVTPSIAQLDLSDVCDGAPYWLSDSLPPVLVELLCTIGDEPEPVNIEPEMTSATELVANNGLIVEGSELTDEIEQQLMLFLTLLSQR